MITLNLTLKTPLSGDREEQLRLLIRKRMLQFLFECADDAAATYNWSFDHTGLEVDGEIKYVE